ncbi:hypothetical protein E3P99_00746 [Wallemia hederae]|uniref:MAGE domain-containing protein n=1 Tax=Wallemia hederae TaxID=1540922 RepID=A0A4T0FWH8_9BASI|nr:hypothetical protein E3P99_00746 [Wallemia hederae]
MSDYSEEEGHTQAPTLTQGNAYMRRREREVASIVRIALSAESRRTTMKRDEVAKKLGVSNNSMLGYTILKASDRMKEVFGYEIKEIPPKESYKLKELSTFPKTNAYVVVNTKSDPNNSIEAFAKWENTHLVGVLHTILAIIMGNGGAISDVQLYIHMKKLGLDQTAKMPGEEKMLLEGFIGQLTRQAYLEKKKSSIGNQDSEYSWGARALLEIGEENIGHFIIDIMNKSRRDSRLSQEAVNELNKKVLDDLQRGVGHEWNS